MIFMRPFLFALTLAFVANAHASSTLVRQNLPPADETGKISILRVNSTNQAYDWVIEFDQQIADYLETRNVAGLQDFQQLKTAAMAHPSFEHFLPLLYTAGAAHETEAPQFFNTSYQAASIAMRSVVWAG